MEVQAPSMPAAGVAAHSQPDSCAGAAAASLARCSACLDGQALVLGVKASLDWDADHDVAALSTLANGRNHFVCMQLLTMVREQVAHVAAARAAGATAQLWRARFVLLATCSDAASGCVVAGALCYPRSGSSSSKRAAVYIELLVCRSPGRGYGSLLLQHIERFVRSARDQLSLGLLDSGAVEAAVAVDCSGGGGDGGCSALPPLAESGGGGGLACCSACSTADGGCPVPGWPALEAACPASPCGSSASSSSALGSLLPSRSCIQGIRLLSVERAAGFYARRGYVPDDDSGSSKELFKPLDACAGTTAVR